MALDYRTADEIKCELLEIAVSGSIKTRIMKKLRITHDRLDEYLRELTDKELIAGPVRRIKNNYYYTTSAGGDAIQNYRSWKAAVGE